jgi:ABC-2 type transport system permease protein
MSPQRSAGQLGSAGQLAPAPGRAGYAVMVRAHAGLELAQLARNGEQVLLTVVIPTLLLVVLAKVDVVDLGTADRVAFLAPGILALAVMSTAFTAQAIATGFERRYGVLKRLGSTPLPRWGLLAGKTLAVLAVELGQVVLLGAVAAALGWRPAGGYLTALPILLLGTAAFSGLALLMAGTLRAEATLAAANLVYLLLLLGGGILVPLARFPTGLQQVLRLLPSTALADGLRTVLTGAPIPGRPVVVLTCWTVASAAAAARWFRWE